MNKLIIASFASLVATGVLAGGGGEEIPFVPAPVVVAAPVVAPVVLRCESADSVDLPRITEHFMPEYSWSYQEWQPNGWNPLNAEWTTVVMDEPNSVCESLWRNYNDQDNDDDRDDNDRDSKDHDSAHDSEHGGYESSYDGYGETQTAG